MFSVSANDCVLLRPGPNWRPGPGLNLSLELFILRRFKFQTSRVFVLIWTFDGFQSGVRPCVLGFEAHVFHVLGAQIRFLVKLRAANRLKLTSALSLPFNGCNT